ncbi:MAG: 2-iminobutanoate/2-iminopropanoate deaminase [Flavobacteriales bacterium]|jgi:2-iminobutanoate/2-iminopropanoate deaminase
MKKIINISGAPAPIAPYNQAILHNDVLYISGQIAINPATGNIVDENISVETHQVMKNIGALLREVNWDYNNVLKCSIFIKDMNQFAEINEVYASYFTANFPARECVQVSCLPKNVSVEISVIAGK